MSLSLFLQGFVIGFSIAAPVGPIGILCIRRTLINGWGAGFASGLGAATADAMYGAVAGLGLTLVSGFLVEQRVWFQLIGGVFLCVWGVRTFLAKADVVVEKSLGVGHAAAYFTAFFLTLTNPMTILMFAVIFAGLGLATGGGAWAAFSLVFGVFCGSLTWWLMLSLLIGVIHTKLRAKHFRWINRLSGVVLLGFGWIALLRLL